MIYRKEEILGREGGVPPIFIKFYDHRDRWIGTYYCNKDFHVQTAGPLFDKTISG